MPFKDPGSGGEGIYLGEGRMRFKLIDLREREGTIDFGKGVQPLVVWVFNVTDPQGQIFTDERGFPAEYWVFTSESLGAKSNGRELAEALLGRALDNSEKGEAVAAAVMDQECTAMVADVDVNGTIRSKPVKGTWQPFKPGAAAARAPAQRPAARQTVPANQAEIDRARDDAAFVANQPPF